MKRSKKIFLFIALIFLLIMAAIAWDFSRRTEFRKFRPAAEEVRN